MDLTRLNSKCAQWLGGGPDDDVVVSSRVRLARNIEGYPFISRCTDKQRARIEELIRNVVTSLSLDCTLHYIRLDQLISLHRELLLERHLIGRNQVEGEGVRAVAFDDAEFTVIAVNEDDHLRVHCTRGGLRLDEVFDRADQLDDMLAEKIPFSYSGSYGFLTASPLHVGTGMRVSVMLHLPGTVMAHEMDHLVEIAQTHNLGVRGGYGEGTHGAGDFYQVFNQATIGVTEADLVSTLREAAAEIVELERSCRLSLYAGHPEEFRGRIARAYELLCSATTISSQEALNFLSLVRLGVEMDLLTATRMATVNDLFLLTLPAHLQTMEGAELDSTVRNERRAAYVRNRFATG